MGPPTFVPCYVCGHKYGSQSIAFHEPKCLIRWRAENNALPTKQRAPTPVNPRSSKGDNLQQHSKDTRFTPAISKATQLSTHSENNFSKQRPRTRTLERPTFIHSAQFSKNSIQANVTLERPNTQTLAKPTPNIVHPIIESSKTNSNNAIQLVIIQQPKQTPETPSHVYAKKPKTNSFNDYRNKSRKSSPSKSSCCGFSLSRRIGTRVLKRDFRPSTFDLNTTNSRVPLPCGTCDRSVAPEKLHSHKGKSESTRLGHICTESTTPQEITSVVSKRSLLPVKVYRQANSQGNRTHTKFKAKVAKMEERAIRVIDKGGSQKPRLLYCYICGRQFGSKSLPLHEPKCLERWKKDNEKLPKNQRRSVPERPPDGLSPSEYNTASWDTFKKQLVPCISCGRTFLPERLEIHQRGCKQMDKPFKGAISLIPANKEVRNDPPVNAILKKSPMITCYICGRQFGSKSIGLHEPQCLKKWHLENDQLPLNMQRKEPKKPEQILKALTKRSTSRTAHQELQVKPPTPQFPGARACWIYYLKWDGTIDLDSMAEAAWQSHLSQLVPCDLCGRTFFPDRLPIHQKGCKGRP